MAVLARQAEIAAPQVDGYRRGGAESLGHPPRAVDIAPRAPTV
ncbi:hypothetical protein [Streptomyces sp. wa1071]|nr:hypothetical protein [Streptomyces sp. wa1071]